MAVILHCTAIVFCLLLLRVIVVVLISFDHPFSMQNFNWHFSNRTHTHSHYEYIRQIKQGVWKKERAKMSTCNTNDSKMFSFLMKEFNLFRDYNVVDDTAVLSSEWRRQIEWFSSTVQCARTKVPDAICYCKCITRIVQHGSLSFTTQPNSLAQMKSQPKCRPKTKARASQKRTEQKKPSSIFLRHSWILISIVIMICDLFVLNLQL